MAASLSMLRFNGAPAFPGEITFRTGENQLFCRQILPHRRIAVTQRNIISVPLALFGRGRGEKQEVVDEIKRVEVLKKKELSLRKLREGESRILQDNPSQLEPKILRNGEYHSLREIQEQKVPLTAKVLRLVDSALNGVEDPTNRRISKIENATSTEKPSTAQKQQLSTNSSKSIRLRNMLRTYKNELYVPEEAFSESISEVPVFEKKVQECPAISLNEFTRFAKAGKVKMLVSRAKPSIDGKLKYQDFVVELKSIPGERNLHRNTWSMKLSPHQAQLLLKAYKGPQTEVEGVYNAFVTAPLSPPSPVAVTLSSRILTEASALTSIAVSMAAIFAALSSVVLNLLTSAFTFASTRIALPLAAPIAIPLVLIFAQVVSLAAFLLVPVIKLTAIVVQFVVVNGAQSLAFVAGLGLKGAGLVVVKFFGAIFSSATASGMDTLFAIFVVLAIMAALAKFTLTRRTRDFTKWDIWQAIEFGQSKHNARVEGQTGIGFADVAGIDEVVEELQELVRYLKEPEKFDLMGAKPPHGVLLEGPPGCGKTLLAKAIAGEAGVPFYQMAGSEFTEILVGIGSARIRDLFQRAKVNRPAVVFIDEVDALGAKRLAGNPDQDDDGSTQERETTLNQLLVELDGFDTGQGVIFLAATNRIDMLDPALMRPGRFDRKISVKPAGPQGRYEILTVHSRDMKLDESVDIKQTALNLTRFSGAELAQVMQEAAVFAFQRGANRIGNRDIDRAIDSLVFGARLPLLPDRKEDGKLSFVRRLALHEMGVAVMATVLRQFENERIEKVQRVSVVPIATDLSRIVFNKVEPKVEVVETRRTITQRLMIYLAGRAAEELFYGRDTSTYTNYYLADASWLAYKMVSIWHLGDKITLRGTAAPFMRPPGLTSPPFSFGGGLFSNYGMSDVRLGGEENDVIEAMARKVLNEAYAETFSLLQEYQAALQKGVNVLVAEGELYLDEIELILEAYPRGTAMEVVEGDKEPSKLPEKHTPTFGELLQPGSNGSVGNGAANVAPIREDPVVVGVRVTEDDSSVGGDTQVDILDAVESSAE